MSEQGSGPKVEWVTSREKVGRDGGAEHFRQISRHARQREEVFEWADGRFEEGTKDARNVNRLGKCAAFLQFRHWFEARKTKLRAASFCQQFVLCSYCASRRSSRYVVKTLDELTSVVQENGPCRFVHLVLSNENMDCCGKAVRSIIEAKGKLLERRRNALKGRTSSSLVNVLGGLFCIEIKKGARSGLWHPHIHAILITPPDSRGKIDQNELWREWQTATGTENVALPWLNEIKQTNEEDELIPALLEVLKYAVKPGSLTPAETWYAHKAVNGKHRLIDTFGVLRGVKVDAKDLADDMDVDGPYVDWFLRRVNGTRGYETIRTSGVCCYGKNSIPKK